MKILVDENIPNISVHHYVTGLVGVSGTFDVEHFGYICTTALSASIEEALAS